MKLSQYLNKNMEVEDFQKTLHEIQLRNIRGIRPLTLLRARARKNKDIL